ncbi:MAG: dCTP deaminase, partial [Deltaproteobacteria bacterium]
GFVDPGFVGTLTLEIINVAPWPITITRGQRIVQIVIDELKSVPTKSYEFTGHYQNQRGPTEAR